MRSRAFAEGQKAREQDAAGGADMAELDEGAHAARDEVVARHEPMKPPGVS